MSEGGRALPDEAATAELGRSLAASLLPGDLVLLVGDLGSGKTELARAIIRTLMADPHLEVPSPSFGLVQPYSRNGWSAQHADLYRIAGEGEIEELGLFDDPQAIVLVEWPERAPRLFEVAQLVVRLSIPPGGAGRIARLERRKAGQTGPIGVN